MTTPNSQTNLAIDIEMLLDQGELTESLYAAVRKEVAQWHWKKTPGALGPVDVVEDDTMQFIVYQLRARNARFIKTRLTLQQEIYKYLIKSDAPEHHELWELLSMAVRAGAKEGWAKRLDAASTARNTNTALWAGMNCSNDSLPLDIAAYELACGKVPVVQRQRENGRILTPSDAAELVRELLTVAVAPVPFGVLVAEAKRHVVWSFHSSESFDKEDDNNLDSSETNLALADRSNDMADWVREEAVDRADRIWREMEARSGQKLLCLYVLPKHFFGRKVKLETFGPVQRVGEQTKQILGIMGGHLHVDKIAEDRRHGQDSVFEDRLKHLVSLVADSLAKKCSENGLDGGFIESTPEEETSQGVVL